MIRAFEIRTNKQSLVHRLASKLDNELVRLQQNGWKIISVTVTPVKEYDYPNYFDSTLFTIIAKNEKI